MPNYETVCNMLKNGLEICDELKRSKMKGHQNLHMSLPPPTYLPIHAPPLPENLHGDTAENQPQILDCRPIRTEFEGHCGRK